MSFDGHVDCQRIEIGPVWPLAIIGKPSVAALAAAPVAALRNLRRDVVAAGLAAAGDFGLRVMSPPRCGALPRRSTGASRFLCFVALVPLVNTRPRHYIGAVSRVILRCGKPRKQARRSDYSGYSVRRLTPGAARARLARGCRRR